MPPVHREEVVWQAAAARARRGADSCRRGAAQQPGGVVVGGGSGGGGAVSQEWRGRLQELRALHRERRHWDLSVDDPPELCAWLEGAFWRWQRGKLSAPEAQSLRAVGLAAEFEARAWNHSLGVLEAYKKIRGDVDPPPELGALHTWLREQRRAWLAGQLPGERVWALKRLGVPGPARGEVVGSPLSGGASGPADLDSLSEEDVEAGEVSPAILYECLGRYIEVEGRVHEVSRALNRFTIPGAERAHRMRPQVQVARFERAQYELDAWFATVRGGGGVPREVSELPLQTQQALAMYVALHGVIQRHKKRP